jgi:hypothetical protein
MNAQHFLPLAPGQIAALVRTVRAMVDEQKGHETAVVAPKSTEKSNQEKKDAGMDISELK